MPSNPALDRVHAYAVDYLAKLPARPVYPSVTRAELLSMMGGPLPKSGEAPEQVVERLIAAGDRAAVAMAGPRYFGFVIGGSLPAAVAADWLTSTWDQNAGLWVGGPAAAVAEEVAAGWLREIFGIPATASVGFVTGGQMANFTALAAARDAVLRRAGIDPVDAGLQNAPPITVVVGEEAHATIFAALRMLGIGLRQVVRVPSDDQGRMRAELLPAALEPIKGPVIVCAQAGNVNSGSFDPIDAVAQATKAKGAWLHVDGAFGLWAAASPKTRALVRGVERADSWATDAHKWLNVPYDSGLVFVADAKSHRAAMALSAAYLPPGEGGERDASEWTPELSRRARGFDVWAALRSLGTDGVAALVERTCGIARRMAERLREGGRVEILNDVVLNQALVRFLPKDGGDADAYTREVIARVQKEGTCWVGGTVWRGKGAMRISVSNWSTTEADADRSVDAMLAAAK
ncbi:MAG TPA: aminotransferase class V-fold PLP-dependent enzyme [bacterium]|nr:aminotransferase class V-fold PLP-dependent enzyme [bacterium]